MSGMPDERWTEAKVFQRVASHWAAPAFTTLPSVRNSTGSSRVVRTADALVVGTWPSRGLWIAGVEIKVSRYDWLLELKKPEKSAEIQRYCHYWWIATPPGIIEDGELPETWGHVECKKASVSVIKQAPRLTPQGIDMLFLGSILRSVAVASVPAEEVESRVAERVEKEVKNRTDRIERHNEAVAAFERGYGGELHDYHAEEAGMLAGVIKKRGVADVLSRLKYLTDSLREAADTCAEASKGIGVEVERPQRRMRNKR